MASNDRFEVLKDLLLREDVADRNDLRQKVETLNEQLNQREKLELRVDPIIKDRIDYLRQHFPELFGPVITDAIKMQIKDAQDEVVEALYHVIGKLIRRYIQMEIEKLSERIDEQINRTFSWEWWEIVIKSWFGGPKPGEVMLRNAAATPQIEEVYVIHQESGLLAGYYSKNSHLDQDMIAGMLTAIKSFVSDAFDQGEQDLQMIEYDNY